MTWRAHGVVKWERHLFFFISNFRNVLNAVCFLLGYSLASELYMPTFRNTLFPLHRRIGIEEESVIHRRLNFICRRFGTLFRLHRRIGIEEESVIHRRLNFI